MQIMITSGVLLLALAALVILLPSLVSYLLAAIFIWVAVALFIRAYKLRKAAAAIRGQDRHIS
jgi:hypothetical protein